MVGEIIYFIVTALNGMLWLRLKSPMRWFNAIVFLTMLIFGYLV